MPDVVVVAIGIDGNWGATRAADAKLSSAFADETGTGCSQSTRNADVLASTAGSWHDGDGTYETESRDCTDWCKFLHFRRK
jgi:hypothetical protein